jgi:hypothetical protein
VLWLQGFIVRKVVNYKFGLRERFLAMTKRYGFKYSFLGKFSIPKVDE